MSVLSMKFIVIFENLLAIYRNYCSLPRKQRFISWMRLFLVIALNVVDFNFRIRQYFIKNDQLKLIYSFLNIVGSFAIITLALCYCKKFSTLNLYLFKTHNYFINDQLYVNSLNRKYNFLIIVNLIYPVMSTCLQIYKNYLDEDCTYSLFIHSLNMVLCSVRLFTEYTVLCFLLSVLSEQIKSMTRKISEERLITKLALASSDDGVICDQHITSFNKWTEIYTEIKEYSDLINITFGMQITIILLMTSLFFVVCLYSMTSISIDNSYVSPDALVYLIRVLIFQAALFAFCRSAQEVQNNIEKLKRRLGKLLIQSLSTDIIGCQNYKEIRNFLHFITNSPIRTQAFGSINIDMTLIPKFVMFFTSYTVIALQFNNTL